MSTKRVGPPDYTDAHTVPIVEEDRPAADWARAVFAGAPAPLRWFLTTAWRFGLGLRLSPGPDRVLGWRLHTEDDTAVLTAESPLLYAELRCRPTGSTLSLRSRVWLRSGLGRLLWTVAVPPHRLIVPYLLRRAAGVPAMIRVQRRLINPVMLRLARFLPGQAVLETTGRHSGLPRRTPVGGRRTGTEFWLVSEFGLRAQYVRNLAAQPRVRLALRGRWHTGTAELLPADDPRARLRTLPAASALVVRAVGTDLRTIRITLDPSDVD